MSYFQAVTERTERKARHEAELIRTRAEKRECIAKLRDRALKAQGKTSSRDSIDKLAFSRERFDFLAKEFDSVRLSDIRFGDLGDVTDYANVNSMFFDQAREMGQMLQLAIDKEELDADEWTENRMLKLRAKLRSFEVMEKLIGSVRREALENPEAVLNKYTYDELLQRAAEKLDEKDIPAYPEFGSNLEKFYNSVLSSYKKNKNINLYKKSGRVYLPKMDPMNDHRHNDLKAFTVSQLVGPVSKDFKEKKLDTHQREVLMKTEGTAQQLKYDLSRRIAGSHEQYLNDVFKIKNSVSTATKIKLGDAVTDDLAILINGIIEKDKDIAGQAEALLSKCSKDTEKEKRYEVLDKITLDFFKTPLNLLGGEESPQELFVNNAAGLEAISRKAYAYKNLIDSDPDYFAHLKFADIGLLGDDVEDNLVSDEQAMVVNKLNKMLAFSDYYRACKLLMTDEYYILHGNDEIGSAAGRNMSKDQRRIYDLMKLTDTYARRIRGGLFEGRRDENIQDSLLTEYERENRRQAYMTGRPDLKKLKPDDIEKTHNEIKAFMMSFEVPFEVYDNLKEFENDRDAFPEAKSHLTDDVKAYLAAFKRVTSDDPQSDDYTMYWDDKQKRLREKLDALVHINKDPNVKNKNSEENEVGSLSFSGRVGEKENLFADIRMTRMIGDLACSWSEDESEEELMDIIDGLTWTIREKADLKDDAAYNYARDRWLRSVKKLFDILYSNVKKYERTYGTLQNDTSEAAFLYSLGEGQADYVRRARFSQDLTKLVGELTCTYNGVKCSLGDVLVQEKLIDISELEDSRSKCGNYYQNQNYNCNTLLKSPGLVFGVEQGEDYDPSNMVTFIEIDAMLHDQTQRSCSFDGPKLSTAERKKYWEKVQATGYGGLLLDNTHQNYMKKQFNQLTGQERTQIKARRESDKGIYSTSRQFLRSRANDLFSNTISQLQDFDLTEADKALIRKMIAFHPAMTRNINKAGKKGQDDIADYIEHLKLFLRAGTVDKKEEKLPEPATPEAVRERYNKIKEKRDARRQAFIYFQEKANDLRAKVTAGSTEGVMSSNGVRDAGQLVLDSMLVRLETCCNMYDALQDMAADRKELKWFSGQTADGFKADLFKSLRLEVIRMNIFSSYYLNLGDLSGRHDSMLGREYMLLQVLGGKLSQVQNNTLDRDVLHKPEVMAALKDHRIRIDAWLGEDLADADKTDLIAMNKKLEELEKAGKKSDKPVGIQEEPLNVIIEEEEEISTSSKKETAPKKTLEQIRQEEAQKKIELEKLKKEIEEKRKIYTSEAKQQKEAELKALIERKKLPVTVPVNRIDLQNQRAPFYGREYKVVRMVNGLQTEATEQTWLDNADKEMAELFDWLMEYYRVNDKELMEGHFADAQIKELPAQNYDVGHEFDQMSKYYEQQTRNNCFCVTGNAMISNLYTKLKNKKTYTRNATQHDMRAYRPRIRKYDPGFEKKYNVDFAQYVDQVADMDRYCGKGKETAGNLFEDADYLFETLENELGKEAENICLNSVRYTIPTEEHQLTENGLIKARNQREIFKETVAKAVNDKQVVGVYRNNAKTGSHYVTVTRIKGNQIFYYD